MTDPASLLVVCRQRLDVLEQQAKAAAAEGDCWYGVDALSYALGRIQAYSEDELRPEAEFIAVHSPAAVLALCGWIRQTLDGAERVLDIHGPLDDGEPCVYCHGPWPCADARLATSTIAGLAAVLAPEQAVKP